MIRTILTCFLLSFSILLYGQGKFNGYINLIAQADSLYKVKDYKTSGLKYSEAFESNGWSGKKYDHYNAACSWALAGFADTAFYYLDRIVTGEGFSNSQLLLTDSDLNTLHADRRWKAIFMKSKLNRTTMLNAIPEGYTRYFLQGYKVLVSDSALRDHRETTDAAITMLDNDLLAINNLPIQKYIIDSLKQARIFMEWNFRDGPPTYHASEQYLLQHGFIPEKTESIEISNISNYIDWHNRHSPFMILHEFAHVYHHKALGFDYVPIIESFNHAVQDKMYVNVGYHEGKGVYRKTVKAYAIENEREYFAELTEAYLGLNETYPFKREDVIKYDQMGFKVLSSIWISKK